MIETALGRRIEKVGVVVGGWSDETQLASSPWIVDGLLKLGLQVDAYDLRSPQLAARIRRSRPDVIFPTCLGAYGEDGKLQGFLETAFPGIPYVGSGVGASAIGMNKLLSKLMFRALGLHTADCLLAQPGNWQSLSFRQAALRLGRPIVLKPALSGASLGLAIVDDEAAFREHLERSVRRYGDVLVERHLASTEAKTEYSVGIIEDERDTVVLPICQVRADAAHGARRNARGPAWQIPAPLPEPAAERLRQLALTVHRSLGCHGLLRVDLILARDGHGEEQPFVLEMDTLPGLIPTLAFPRMCAAHGLDFPDMLAMLLRGAFRPRPMEIPRRGADLPELPPELSAILPSLPRNLRWTRRPLRRARS
jgi:D-alanine-D-alanine ligase